MRADRIAQACADQSGAGAISDKASELTLIAIACATEDMAAWRKNIKKQYRQRHPKCGSVFLIFILPLLISLISNWLAKWIFKDSDLPTLKAEALNALG